MTSESSIKPHQNVSLVPTLPPCMRQEEEAWSHITWVTSEVERTNCVWATLCSEWHEEWKKCSPCGLFSPS